jgi:hypothetical protein
MAKYLQTSCPKCNGYLRIVVPDRNPNQPVQAINGRRLKCGYRYWFVENAGATILIAAQPNVKYERTAFTYGPTNVEGRYTRVREQISAVS